MKEHPIIFTPLAAQRAHEGIKTQTRQMERVQDISETDAISEGCVNAYGRDFHTGEFRTLWGTIHGRESWARNPWVWVLSFRKVED